MSKGEFIDCFELATVCPVFKKGDFNNINNYRPVSLLSNILKLLEKFMYNRLYLFLETQNFFYNYQFGFRKKLFYNSCNFNFSEKNISAVCLQKGNPWNFFGFI